MVKDKKDGDDFAIGLGLLLYAIQLQYGKGSNESRAVNFVAEHMILPLLETDNQSVKVASGVTVDDLAEGLVNATGDSNGNLYEAQTIINNWIKVFTPKVNRVGSYVDSLLGQYSKYDTTRNCSAYRGDGGMSGTFGKYNVNMSVTMTNKVDAAKYLMTYGNEIKDYESRYGQGLCGNINTPPSQMPAPASSTPSSSKPDNTKLIVIIVCVVLGILLVGLLVAVIVKKKGQQQVVYYYVQ